MQESRRVTIGLDVHASSVRLAAIRGDELLGERTLPYDEEVVERCMRRWPDVQCCYEAGPTGFGLYRYLVERGIWVRGDRARLGAATAGRSDQDRLSKFCLRHGRRLPGMSWGGARRKWLGEQRFEFAAQQQTLDAYVHTVDL